jgi:hypothetical protein
MKKGTTKRKYKYNTKFIILYVYHLYLNYSMPLISEIISHVSKNEVPVQPPREIRRSHLTK